MASRFWMWGVGFARWTSPDHVSLTVHVVAESVEQAADIARDAAVREWGKDAGDISIQTMFRGQNIAMVAPAAPSPGSGEGEP